MIPLMNWRGLLTWSLLTHKEDVVSEKAFEFQTAVMIVQTDRNHEVILAVEEAQDILAMVNRERLDEDGVHEYRAIAATLTGVVNDFRENYPAARGRANAQIANLKQLNSMRQVFQLALIPVAGYLLFKAWHLCLMLILVGGIARHFAMSYLTAESQKAAELAQEPVRRSLLSIGHPEDGTRAASGLCARADALYLASLQQDMLAMERLQRRSMKEAALEHKMLEELAQSVSGSTRDGRGGGARWRHDRRKPRR